MGRVRGIRLGAGHPGRVRRLRRGRRVVAGGLGLVMAAGTSLAPVVVTAGLVAGVTAASVASASAPAKAASGSVLMLLQNGETAAPEAADVPSGFTVTQVTPTTWEGMTAAQFEAYSALVIGDPSSGGTCSALTPTTASSGTDALGTTWQSAVTGNISVLGTAPALPADSGSNALVSAAIGYAGAGFSSSGGTGTGLYVSLNCEYSTSSAGTAVPLLNGVEGIGADGGLTVQGGLACTDPGTVNTWEGDAASAFSGLASGSLTSAQWPSPGCPVHEAFDAWPAIFVPVAYDAASDARANFTASDGATGQPYVLLGTPPLTTKTQIGKATLALAPSTGGEVPAGTTAGGGNAAAPGVSQPAVADPVNTENGDLSESSTDESVPTFGPSLGFGRSYDAQVAEQQTQAGTPGPLGYGWTDSLATSLATAAPVPGDIYTLDGLATNTGNGGPPAKSAMNQPSSVYMNSGNTYIADSSDNRVEEVPGTSGTQWGIPMTAGDIYTIAGSPSGKSGESQNGVTAATSLLNDPVSVSVSSAGDLIIDDFNNCRVEEIPASTTSTQWGGDVGTMNAGDMYVIAGRSAADCTIGLDSKEAIQSDLNLPDSLSMSGGNVYIADTLNNRIQELAGSSGSQWGQSMTAGDVYTVAGSPSGATGQSSNGLASISALMNGPQGVMVGSGNIYVADTGNCRVEEVPVSSGTQWGVPMTLDDLYTVAGRGANNCTIGEDGKTAITSNLITPNLAVAQNGNLYIADSGDSRVQEVAGTAHTEFGQSMTASFVYTVAGSSTGAIGDSGEGGAATSALLGGPAGLWVDSSGNLYVADFGDSKVWKVAASSAIISDYAGGVGTFAQEGDGGPATTAALNTPQGEASDAAGDIFIADALSNRVQEIAATSHTQFGIAMTAGDVYTVAGQQDGRLGNAGDGGPARSAVLDAVESVAVDGAGNLFLADTGNNRVQEVPASTGTQFGQSMTTGDIYTVAGSATGVDGTSGDNGLAASALLDEPDSVVLDKAGDLYIADSSQIQEVFAAGGQSWGQSMTAGDIYTIAGSAAGTPGSSGDNGLATSALLDVPFGVALDSAGNLYIADTENSRIQEVPVTTGTQRSQPMTKGDIYTIAGSATGLHGDSGDGGPATSALLSSPASIAVNAIGDVYVADYDNNRVQEIPDAPGVQWGQQMTANDMYTVTGSSTGTVGDSGDGGPAASALLSGALSVALDQAGNLYVTDQANNSLREVVSSVVPTISPAPGQTSSLVIAPGGAAPGGLTVSEPGGAQVTFYSQSGGTCAAPDVTAGGYCVLPEFQGATLTFNSSAQTYAFSSAPGAGTLTYSWDGQLISEADMTGDTLSVTYQSPAPGSGNCPAAASSCETVTSASGRVLVVGSNGSGLVTSVTDPMGRAWAYGYSGSDLTSATDPMGHKTTYTYGAGSTGNPLLASDLLTITGPNAQPGGPDAGKSTVNVYDSLGRVTQQTDPLGAKTTFNYCVSPLAGDCMNASTGNGYVTVTDPDANTMVLDYQSGTVIATTVNDGSTPAEDDSGPNFTATGNAAGTLLPVWTANGDGAVTSSTYDQSGNAIATTDPNGNVSTMWPTSLGAARCNADAMAATPCSASQAGPSTVTAGQAITPPSSAPPAGASYSLYDADGRALYDTVGVYAPGSATASITNTTYTLFKGNSVTLNGTNITCSVVPPSASLPCAEIDSAGKVTQLAYDSAGDLTSESTPDGNGSQLATDTYAYDADGEGTATISADGNITGANAANYTSTSAYNADGQETSAIAAAGSGATVTPRTTSYGYDADGNQLTVKDSRGFTTTTTYDADDESTLVTDPAGNASLTCYDGAGDVVQTVPPAGVAANSLTPASCPTSFPAGFSDRLAADATTQTYDATGDVTALTTGAPAGQSGTETTSYSYDPAGLVLKVTSPPASTGGPNQVAVSTYDADENLLSQTTGYGTPAASTTAACYNADNDQTASIAADGNVSGIARCNTSPSHPWTVDPTAYPAQAAYQSTNSYDSAGDLVSATSPVTAASPSGATTTYTYDADGDQLTTSDPNGVTVTTAYTTPGGNAASISFSGSSAHTISYTYDAEGNQTGMTDNTGTSSYVYNPFGELTSTTNGAQQSVSYTYDADGDTTGTTYPLPSTATWATSSTVSDGYDNADQLTSVTDFNGHQIAITPGADGMPSAATLGSTGDSINYSYDPSDSTSAIALRNSSSTLQSFTYSDAPDSGILSEADVPASAKSPASYTYDGEGRVTSMTPGTGSALNYAFDASGNLTTLPNGSTAAYDHAGELTSAALSGTTTSYGYNADGERLTSKQGSATITSGTWNGAGQLTSYNGPAADMTAATYDGTGMRASETTGSGTQHFLWGAGSQLLMDSANAYIYALDGAPTEQVSLSTGAISYLSTDSLGSVRGVVASSGALTATTSYDAWGNPQTTGGLTGSTPFGYAGGYTDPTGLLYLIHRYYDPSTGQFTSVDPDVSETGEPYGYAGDDPVNGTDPDGQWMIGLPSRTNHFDTEAEFTTWVRGVIGGVPYLIRTFPGSKSFRDVDLFQAGEKRINELKIGRQRPQTATNTQQANRDSDLIKHPAGYCHRQTRGGVMKCWQLGAGSIKSGVWWFGYKGASGCQRSGAALGEICPNIALRKYLLAGGADGQNKHLNIVLVIYFPYRKGEQPGMRSKWTSNFDYKSALSDLYRQFKVHIRNALMSDCPEKELDDGFLPVIKFSGFGC